jgi:tetratricopeptide (TPR) repeat protein
LSPIINSNVAWCYYLAPDYESAIQQLRATLDLHPDFAVAHEYLGQAYAEQSRTNEALAEFEKLLDMAPIQPAGKSFWPMLMVDREIPRKHSRPSKIWKPDRSTNPYLPITSLSHTRD